MASPSSVACFVRNCGGALRHHLLIPGAKTALRVHRAKPAGDWRQRDHANRPFPWTTQGRKTVGDGLRLQLARPTQDSCHPDRTVYRLTSCQIRFPWAGISTLVPYSKAEIRLKNVRRYFRLCKLVAVSGVQFSHADALLDAAIPPGRPRHHDHELLAPIATDRLAHAPREFAQHVVAGISCSGDYAGPSAHP